ncbi:hypothetical protein NW381_001953 [Salmonella enterica]|nr:hypothetical protein [Salmonella enterica]EJS3015139.1 hypothetical protein [Salmonella enterica]EJS3017814.1 hypothetical protein [Salmonella enterica]
MTALCVPLVDVQAIDQGIVWRSACTLQRFIVIVLAGGVLRLDGCLIGFVVFVCCTIQHITTYKIVIIPRRSAGGLCRGGWLQCCGSAARLRLRAFFWLGLFDGGRCRVRSVRPAGGLCGISPLPEYVLFSHSPMP